MADREDQYGALLEQFYGNRLLFGDPNEARVVAIEVAGDNAVEYFRRTAAGELVRERRPLQLFALVADRNLLADLRAPYRTLELAGGFRYRYLVRFDALSALEVARRHLRECSGKSPSASDAPYLILTDPIQQHLMLTGVTLFLGMQFSDLRRLQLDCEPQGLRESGAAPAREDQRILAIAITDSSGFARVLSQREMDEREMIAELVRIIRERDPDVIEGHHLLRSQLAMLEARARRLRIPLACGRDGRAPRGRLARLQIAERTIAYRRYELYGRHLVDTWLLAQHYDIASRELEGFSLDELSRHFGAARSDRVYLEPAEIHPTFARDPQRVEAHALDEARETGALAEALARSHFVQTQIFPYSYQNVILRGNATRIDALLMRAYLAARHSIPAPNAPSEVAGGYTEMRRSGVARNVLHCDVTSLYPSLMLEGGHAPASDRLGVFLTMLADLRSFRLLAKNAMRELSGPARRNMEALQQTFKILVNSFYGYLGFSLGHFNDFVQANNVTRRGRELIRRAIAEFEARGAEVIEVDTDGIYFVAPFPLDDAAAAQQLVDAVSASMPPGIRLEIDGRYPAMLSYKMKNYVLLDERGELTIRGSGLRSRGLERFQRSFMERLFLHLLGGAGDAIAALHREYQEKIRQHRLPITDLMKTETLQDSLEVYRSKRGGKRRNVAAAYELALKSGQPYQSGDRISYYVTGSSARVKVADAARLVSEYDPAHPDDNAAYYAAKLEDLYEKFRPFIEQPGLTLEPSQVADEAPQPTLFDGDPAASGDDS